MIEPQRRHVLQSLETAQRVVDSMVGIIKRGKRYDLQSFEQDRRVVMYNLLAAQKRFQNATKRKG